MQQGQQFMPNPPTPQAQPSAPQPVQPGVAGVVRPKRKKKKQEPAVPQGQVQPQQPVQPVVAPNFATHVPQPFPPLGPMAAPVAQMASPSLETHGSAVVIPSAHMVVEQAKTPDTSQTYL
jgi:hypothetical protein